MRGNLLVGFLVAFFIFVPIERAFSLKRGQRIFRKGWLTDATHFFLTSFVSQIGVLIVAGFVLALVPTFVRTDFQTVVARQPGWLQFVEALLLADFAGYFGHRAAHRVPWLWKFHAVHHSSAQLDWLASVRLHPIDQMFIRAVVILPLAVMGFTRETLGAYVAFASFQALFIHSNVRLRFGPLRWIVATPEFHHWHHSADAEARDRNFAGQCPLIDYLFGTLHLPDGRWPETYGADAPVPERYVKQLAFPFNGRRSLRPATSVQSVEST